MAKHGKRYRGGARRRSIASKRYAIDDAIRRSIDAGGAAKFDETVELAVRLGVDPRQADQNVRGTVVLPHGTGKTRARRSCSPRATRRRRREEAGADFVGADDLVKKIQEEQWLDFDTAIATPDMMGAVGRLGKILGPRGLMPNPKVGTVTFDVGKAVREVKAGKVEFRVEKAGIVHVPIGKRSFGAEKLLENAHALAREPAAREAGGGEGQLPAEHRGLHDDGPVGARSTRHARARRGLTDGERRHHETGGKGRERRRAAPASSRRRRSRCSPSIAG